MFSHPFKALARGFRRRPDPVQEQARQVYAAIVAQARQPAFYAALGVPDTLDGRFELVVLHTVLVLHRLRRDGSAGRALGRQILEAMFADFDANLREMGAGDLGVPPRVKRMAQAFYGRAAAYEAALAASDSILAAAFARNLFGTVEAAPQRLAAVVAYVRRTVELLTAAPWSDMEAGRLPFEAPMAEQADPSFDPLKAERG